jgi:hypothetical protein
MRTLFALFPALERSTAYNRFSVDKSKLKGLLDVSILPNGRTGLTDGFRNQWAHRGKRCGWATKMYWRVCYAEIHNNFGGRIPTRKNQISAPVITKSCILNFPL